MYQNLIKAYYTDRDKYEETYAALFHAPSTEKFDFEINGWQAFIVFCADLTNLVFDIVNLNAGLDELTRELPSIAMTQYAYNKLIDEIHLTNDIEGVRSTRKEISEVLISKEKKNKSQRFYNLVRKYEKLMSHDPIPLESCRDIRNLYDEIVLKEVLDENKDDAPDGIYFRANTVFVYDEKMNRIHEGLYPEEKIIDAMTKSLMLFKEPELNRLISISVFHYMIGYIHPFYNGNGRLNRFISSYLLSDCLNYLVSYAISGTIKQDRNGYNKMFQQANDEKNRGDLTPFVIGFLSLVKNSLVHLNNRIAEKCEKLKYFGDKLEQKFTGNKKYFQILYVLLQNSLFGFQGMSVKNLMQACEESRVIVSNLLSENKHLLRKEKSKGNKFLYDIDLETLCD